MAREVAKIDDRGGSLDAETRPHAGRDGDMPRPVENTGIAPIFARARVAAIGEGRSFGGPGLSRTIVPPARSLRFGMLRGKALRLRPKRARRPAPASRSAAAT
jgi:hypothetical protein